MFLIPESFSQHVTSKSNSYHILGHIVIYNDTSLYLIPRMLCKVILNEQKKFRGLILRLHLLELLRIALSMYDNLKLLDNMFAFNSRKLFSIDLKY